MAARGAGAAAGDAGDRVARHGAGNDGTLFTSVQPGLGGDRLRRGPQRDHYVPRGRRDRMPALAADLVRRHVTVIVAVGGWSGAERQGGDADHPGRFRDEPATPSRLAW